MFKFFLALLLLLQLTHHGFAQNETNEMDGIDSLLADPTLAPAEKINAIIEQTRITVSSYQKGSIQLKKALVIAEENTLLEEKAEILITITRFAVYQQDFDSVYFYGNNCIDFLKNVGDSSLIPSPLGLIMSSYYSQDRYQDAVDLFNANRIYFNNEVKNPNEMQAYYALGINFEQLGEIDSTFYYLEKALLEIDPKENFDAHLNLSGVLLAVYSENGRKDKADKLIKEILARKAQIEDPINLISLNSSLGQHYQYNADYHTSLAYFEEALALSIDADLKIESSRLYADIYQLEKDAGHFDNALYALERHKTLEDSINNISVKIANQEFEEKYQNDKLIIENLKKEALLQNEETIRLQTRAKNSRNKRNFILAILGLLLIILLGLLWIVIIRNNRKKEALQAKLVQEETERDLVENQLMALRSQMNPHFVFNAINSIQGLILKEKTEDSYNSLITFSELVRNTLEYSNKEFIDLEDEMEYLNLYLSLEKLRFSTDFSYTIEDNTENEHIVPSIVIQPFVENALKHGLFHKKGTKTLSINFYETDHLICEIIDNGIGRAAAQEIAKRRAKMHNSFSTEAITTRMKILSEKYDGKVYYEIIDCFDEEDKAVGTKIRVHLAMVL